MADLEFNKQDIENLARTLASKLSDFSPTEWDLLLAIFASAASNAKPSGLSQPSTLPVAKNSAPELPDGADYLATQENYQQQLLTAYIAGNSFDSITGGGSGDTGKID